MFKLLNEVRESRLNYLESFFSTRRLFREKIGPLANELLIKAGRII